MTGKKPIILDANILFSALLKQDSKFAQTILGSSYSFFICEAVIVELFRHKERIIQFSKLSEDEVVTFYYLLLQHVSIIKESLIDKNLRQKAVALCVNVDPSDAPHVALTLHLNGMLWTGDTHLKAGLLKQGFNSFYEPK